MPNALVGPYGITTALLPSYNFGFASLKPEKDLDQSLALLAACKAAGKKLVVSLVGGRELFQNPDKSLNTKMWMDRLKLWVGSGIEAYAPQIVCHRMGDEFQDVFGNWGGHEVLSEQVAEMAAFSHNIFPGLKVSLGTNPTWLTGLGLPAKTVDVIHTVYHQKETVADVLKRDLALCKKLGVEYIVGFNVLHGGVVNGTPMAASELLSAGTLFLKNKSVKGLLLWERDPKDPSYFERPDVIAALATLSK